MKKILLAASLVLFAACQPKGPTQEQYDALAAKYDSLASHNSEMQDLIGAVSMSLDSISAQEGMLFMDNEDGSHVTKKQILDRIQAYKDLLARQQAQLEALQKQQTNNKAALRELKGIIAALRAEIGEKETRIAQLEEELTVKNKDITVLQQDLEKSKAYTTAVEEVRAALEDVAVQQDRLLNIGYYLVASKSRLKELGLAKGVFKKKTDYANIDPRKFEEIDIREFTRLEIGSKSAKLLTEKPEGSYTLRKNDDDSYTLIIDDVKSFWGASPYLIIMTK